MKLCFIDVETGGVNPKKDALLQLAMIVEVDGEIKNIMSLNIKPFKSDNVSDEALTVNKIKRSDFKDFIEPEDAYYEITKVLSKYVDKYDRKDKFHFIAYNAYFDSDFVRNFFLKNGDKYYGSFFFWPPIDVAIMSAVHFAKTRSNFNNFKLMTVAKALDVYVESEKAHNALYDIEITRKMFKKMMGE